MFGKLIKGEKSFGRTENLNLFELIPKKRNIFETIYKNYYPIELK